MKKLIWFAILVALFMLSACGQDAETADADMNVQPVETVFNSAEAFEPGENVTLSVTVTQGTESVEDADEVVFEVWQSGNRKESEMLPADHVEDGVYEAETIFDAEGLYFAQAHTTARRLHVMPKQEITVGDPDPSTIVPDDSDDQESMDKMEGHGDGH